jgi:phosphotriesterase-related protein
LKEVSFLAVMTINGKVDARDLGVVTPHEHIFIDMSVFFSEPDEISLKQMSRGKVTIDKLGVLKRNPFALLDNVQMMDAATQLEEIMYFKRAGGRTVVDATTVGLGRDPALLADVAARTGLNVILGAGYYVKDSQKAQALELSIEEMEAQIVGEVTRGIGHTDIRAGIIGEIGVSHIMHPFEKRSLTAACRAQAKTGAPLMIHINPWSEQGIEAMAIVREHKLPAGKIVICHIDVENHEDYIFRLLDTGVFVEFDNFGKEMATDLWDVKPGSGRFATDWERIHLLKKLVDRGFERQILLSCDVCLKSLLHAYGGWGYDHVLTHIVPMAIEVGVTREQIDMMLVGNPARWLDYNC